MSRKKRAYKRFSLKNALISFPGGKNEEGMIANISKGGFKISTNMDFENGEIITALIDLRSIPDQALNPNFFELKVKILWKSSNSKDQRIKNVYGACFANMSSHEKELLHSLFESFHKNKKMSDDDIEEVLLEIDAYLEKFRNPK